jgi:hypothetical protein
MYKSILPKYAFNLLFIMYFMLAETAVAALKVTSKQEDSDSDSYSAVGMLVVSFFIIY